MSVSKIALTVMSESRLPLARPASLLVGDGDHFIQQCGVRWTAEQTQALLKDSAGGGRSHGRSFIPLGQVGKSPFDEFFDRSELAGANGGANRLLLIRGKR